MNAHTHTLKWKPKTKADRTEPLALCRSPMWLQSCPLYFSMTSDSAVPKGWLNFPFNFPPQFVSEMSLSSLVFGDKTWGLISPKITGGDRVLPRTQLRLPPHAVGCHLYRTRWIHTVIWISGQENLQEAVTYSATSILISHFTWVSILFLRLLSSFFVTSQVVPL